MSKDAGQSGIDQLIEISKKAHHKIEDRIFKDIEEVAPPAGFSYILVTWDMRAGTYFAPVTNVPHEKLIALFGEGVLETIRNQFPLGIVREGLVAGVCQEILKTDATGSEVLLPLTNRGKVDKKRPFHLPAHLNNPVKVYGGLARRIVREVKNVRDSVKAKGTTYLYIRKDLLAGNGPREAQPFQIAFAFKACGSSEDLASLRENLEKIALVSGYATHMLLYERERYFQKALRQATSGEMYKCGDGTSIGEQIDLLKKLWEHERWAVPRVQAGEKSWYRMTRFDMTSLMDLLTFTPGFSEHEIFSIANATFEHLRETYWGDVRAHPMSAQDMIKGALDVALGAIEKASTHLQTQVDAIDSDKAVVVGSTANMDVISKNRLQPFRPIIEAIKNRTPLTVKLVWNETNETEDISEFLTKDPRQQLNGLGNAVRCGLSTAASMEIEDKGLLHGDAHFGNILIDPSIPDDPLILSIDQKRITLNSLAKDPVYDVAKLVFSTTCLYGVIYHKALVSKKDKMIWTVSRLDAEPVKLSNVGGISGDQIIAVTARASDDARRYHRWAQKAILHKYTRYVDANSTASSKITSSVQLLQLWLLTIRHAFSILEKLFPARLEEAMSMYLVARCLVGRGISGAEELIKKLADPKMDPSAAQEEFLKVFYLWPEEADNGVKK